MDKTYKVSVIIPVYNTEKYITDCLNSLIRQTFDSVEIIIVNDGSTDNSKEIIFDFMREFPHIKYLEQNNCGQGSARNVGLNNATGKYIYFMDSDDLIDLDALRRLVQYAEDEALDLVLFDGLAFYDEDYIGDRNFQFNYVRKKNYGFYNSGQQLFASMIESNDYSPSPCLYIVNHNYIKNNDFVFIEGDIHEDEIFTVKILLKASKCKHVNEPFFRRRIRNNSTMTSSKYLKRFYGYKRVFYEFIELSKSTKFEDIRIKEALNHKIGSIYRSIILLYTMLNVDDRNKVKMDMKIVQKIAAQYRYFGIKGFLITQNKYLYKNYKKIREKTRQIKNHLKKN